MMTDYIKRDALLEARELAICAYENAGIFNADAIRNHLKPLLDAVVDTPAADVAEVRNGRWEWDTEDIYRCSNCAEKSHVKEVMGHPEWDYCPNCGAKMDGGDSNSDICSKTI